MRNETYDEHYINSVTALGDTVAQAAGNAYRAMGMISFPGIHYRRDIARRAIERS